LGTLSSLLPYTNFVCFILVDVYILVFLWTDTLSASLGTTGLTKRQARNYSRRSYWASSHVGCHIEWFLSRDWNEYLKFILFAILLWLWLKRASKTERFCQVRGNNYESALSFMSIIALQ
jgi:hypothetical protein